MANRVKYFGISCSRKFTVHWITVS